MEWFEPAKRKFRMVKKGKTLCSVADGERTMNADEVAKDELDRRRMVSTMWAG